MTEIIFPILAIGGLGLLFGLGLGIADKKFAVPVDERVSKIKESLPGANCGGCGFAGCEAFAKAVVSGEASISGCPVCSSEQVKNISIIMNLEPEVGVKKIAHVKCQGTTENAGLKFEYHGVADCLQAHLVGNGPKQCSFGCLGYGTCVHACAFGALEIKDGVAIVDKERCTGCGLCTNVCPRHLIDLVEAKDACHVLCKSHEKGKVVKQSCSTGCIGCSLCVKQCEFGAIQMEEGLAKIDESLCTNCGKCLEKCPTKAIKQIRGIYEK